MRREELVTLVEPVLLEEGFELVECSVSRTARSQAFRLSVDREAGVPLEACARISRKVALLLDANPLLRGAYQLEVSSPGMNRPIWSADHFRRFRGERIRFELADTPAPNALQGTIGELQGDGVRIRLEGGEEPLFLLSRISRARLHLDPWKKDPRKKQADDPESAEAAGESAAGNSANRTPRRGRGARPGRKRTRGQASETLEH